MSAEQHRRILSTFGEVLYGLEWRGRMAEALDVRYDTLGDWLSGRRNPPPDTWSKLYRLALLREREMTRAIVSLSDFCKRNGLGYRDEGRGG